MKLCRQELCCQHRIACTKVVSGVLIYKSCLVFGICRFQSLPWLTLVFRKFCHTLEVSAMRVGYISFLQHTLIIILSSPIFHYITSANHATVWTVLRSINPQLELTCHIYWVSFISMTENKSDHGSVHTLLLLVCILPYFNFFFFFPAGCCVTNNQLKI